MTEEYEYAYLRTEILQDSHALTLSALTVLEKSLVRAYTTLNEDDARELQIVIVNFKDILDYHLTLLREKCPHHD